MHAFLIFSSHSEYIGEQCSGSQITTIISRKSSSQTHPRLRAIRRVSSCTIQKPIPSSWTHSKTSKNISPAPLCSSSMTQKSFLRGFGLLKKQEEKSRCFC